MSSFSDFLADNHPIQVLGPLPSNVRHFLTQKEQTVQTSSPVEPHPVHTQSAPALLNRLLFKHHQNAVQSPVRKPLVPVPGSVRNA